MSKNRKTWLQRRRRIFEIIEAGSARDWVSRGYDILSTLVLLVNVSVTILYTFDSMELQYGETLLLLEAITMRFSRWITACGSGQCSSSIRIFRSCGR